MREKRRSMVFSNGTARIHHHFEACTFNTKNTMLFQKQVQKYPKLPFIIKPIPRKEEFIDITNLQARRSRVVPGEVMTKRTRSNRSTTEKSALKKDKSEDEIQSSLKNILG